MKRTALAALLIGVLAIASVTAYSQAKKSEKPEKVKDPVCGMMVEKDPSLSHDHKGTVFYFCSKADLEEFKKAPEKFTKK